MKLCSACDRFRLHDFAQLPDQIYAKKLKALQAGARATCSLCLFLEAQLAPVIRDFPSHLDDTYIRLKYHDRQSKAGENRVTAKNMLGLDELELYLVDKPFQTNTERRSKGCFLGLAATSGESFYSLRNHQ